jgi:hypothetical protein
MRKKRNDRNYVLYRVTADGQEYIGLTVAVGRAFLRSVKVRLQKHQSRAKCENKAWAFCAALRVAENVEYEVLEVVRGRKKAYEIERQYIKEYQPSLNTF